MTDQRTPHHGLPLPHPDNDLEKDLPRLRSAITMIDAELAALQQQAVNDSDSTTLRITTLTQRVDALRADLDTLTALTVSAL